MILPPTLEGSDPTAAAAAAAAAVPTATLPYDAEKKPVLSSASVSGFHSDPESQLSDGNATAAASHVETQEAYDYPDGGTDAWAAVGSALLSNALAWGYPATYGVYQLHYTTTLGLPASTIAWPGSTQLFLAFFVCAPAGRLADAGYVRSTVATGGFLVVLGTLLTAEAIRWGYGAIFAVQGVLTGLGLGLIFMPGISVLSSYWLRHRNLAMALSATGTGFGSVVFPAIVQYLIPHVGFAWAVRCQAFAAAGAAAAAVVLLRPKLEPRKAGPWVDWPAFKEMQYMLYTAGIWLFFWSLHFGVFYINVYAREKLGVSPTKAVGLLLIMNAMSVPSRPIVGFIADRFLGAFNCFVIFMFLLAAMFMVWLAVDGLTSLYVFSVFFGLTSGAAQGMFPGSLASMTKDPQKMGTRFGMVCTMVAFATLSGPPTAGAIIDATGGNYVWAQVWAGCAMASGAFVIFLARLWATKWKVIVKI